MEKLKVNNICSSPSKELSESERLLLSSKKFSSCEEDSGLPKESSSENDSEENTRLPKESPSENDTAIVVIEPSKLFKGKREVFILIGLSLIIFSMQCGESIIAPFFIIEVSKSIYIQFINKSIQSVLYIYKFQKFKI